MASQLTDGSVFSHVTIGTDDIARATAFYDKVLAPLNMGAPGIRGHYHENYYGTYVRDPDGDKICVVRRAPE